MKIFEILEKYEEKREPNEISVLISEEALFRCGLSIVQESIWIDSGYKNWMYRVDPENPNIPQKRHIHITKSKHTSSKNMQASWNADGTRHDRNSFNTNVGSVDRVQEIARNVLKIAPEVTLENYSDALSRQMLVDEISSSSDGKVAYVLVHLA
jgi:hypothetical protein